MSTRAGLGRRRPRAGRRVVPYGVAMADDDVVLYEERDTVAYITLNRPEKLNTLNGAVIAGMAVVLMRDSCPPCPP